MIRPGSVKCLAAILLAVAAGGRLCAQQDDQEQKTQAVVDEVCKDVSRLRKLEFKRPVPLRMATRDEGEKYVLGELEKQWPTEQLEADERAFKMLGLLPADYHLHDELVALYREQLAGFYDPKADRMVLVKIDFLKGLTKMLLSHELTHALQDQHFDLGRLLEGSTHTLDADFTISSLIEGDATLVMMDYVMEKALEDPGMLAEALKADVMANSKKLLGAPPLMKHMLVSPYLYGMGFVSHFRNRGWERVNEIYAELPLSAEQMMHPEKYYPRRDFPQHIDFGVEFAPAAKGQWKRGIDSTLGEIGVLALVESWGELLKDGELRKSAGKVAAGWDGDRLVSFEGAPDSPGAIRIWWISTWDTPEDAAEMRDALRKWVSKWNESETEDGWSRHTIVVQPEVNDAPGPDVVCVMLRTSGRPADFGLIPPYTKTVVRSVSQPVGTK